MEAKRLVGEHAEKRRIAERATEQMQAVVERAVANADGMAITTKKLIAELSRMQKEKVDSKARVVERETLPSNRKTKKKRRSANADLSYTPRPPRATPSSTKAENRKKKTVRSVKTTGQPDLRTKRAETRERHLGHQDKTTHHSPLTTHHSPPTTRHSPLTTHHSPLATHHSPLATRHSPLATYYSLVQ